MKKHVKNYLEYFDLTEADFILCEICSALAVDLHHIKYKSRGGNDHASNIIAICRNCHELAHSNVLTQEHLQEIHNIRMGI